MNNEHLFLNKAAVCRNPAPHCLPHSCSSSAHYRGQTQAEKTNGLSPVFCFPNSTSTKAKENTDISHQVGVGLVSWANVFCPQGSDHLWIPRCREVGYILPHSPTSSHLRVIVLGLRCLMETTISSPHFPATDTYSKAGMCEEERTKG